MLMKPADGDWITYGRDQAETHHSPLKQIDATNVGRLKQVWSYEIDMGGGGTQESTPLFHDGVIYSVTNWSKVFAVDARTGKEKWRFDPEVNQQTVRPKICCGIVNRGAALYEGMLIRSLMDNRIADDLGFSSQSHFNRVFARLTGMTPLKARRMLVG